MPSSPLLAGFEGHEPRLGAGVFLAPGAAVIGDVSIGAGSSIWYHCVLRGDVASIRIGERTNIQDLTMVHVTSGRFATSIGDDVTVGHRAILHGCTVGNRVLIGMGAILLDGVFVEDESIVGSGALVSPGTRVTGRTLWLGSPARAVRELRSEELASFVPSAASYCKLAERHAASFERGLQE